MNAMSFHDVIIAVLATAFIAVPSPAPAISSSCEYTGPPSPPRGKVIGELRVMTMNVWGQNQDSETICEARLKYIGEKLANHEPLFDVIGLTEVHPDYVGMTCDGEKLVKGLRVNGQYGRGKARWGHPETSAKYYDGGTSLFSTSEFDWVPYKDHVERYSPKYVRRTAHGFVFARIPIVREITRADGSITKDHRAGMVDVYVTHLYSKGGGSTKCDQQCRYRQLQQLARGIHERSANSGNPVLVMGDFNIRGPNPTPSSCDGNFGYGDIMDVLRNPRDIWLEAHPNGGGATKVGDSRKRIDYIFVLTDPYFTNSTRQLMLSSPGSVRLIEWEMPGYNVTTGSYLSPGTTWIEGPIAVSDHYGIEATFEVHLPASGGGSTSPGGDRGTSGTVVRDHRGDPNPHGLERPEGSVVKTEVVQARRGTLAAPSQVMLGKVQRTSLTLVWMDNTSFEHGVAVERGSPTPDRGGVNYHWKRVFNVEERVESRMKGTGLRSDTDDGLSPDTDYCYRLRAYRDNTFSDYSEPVCTRTQ